MTQTAATSSFRKAIGALLAQELCLTPTPRRFTFDFGKEEKAIDNWLSQNSKTILVHSENAKHLEEFLIRQIDPELNITKRYNNHSAKWLLARNAEHLAVALRPMNALVHVSPGLSPLHAR